MKAEFALALFISAALIGCTADPAPAVPAIQEPRCGDVMKEPEKHTAADVKRCEEAGFERTDRKGGF
jgi:hypothetical protein